MSPCLHHTHALYMIYKSLSLSLSKHHSSSCLHLSLCLQRNRQRERAAADTKRRANDMRRHAHAFCIIYEMEVCKRMMKACMYTHIKEMNMHHNYTVYELDTCQKCRLRETSSETSSQKIIHTRQTKTTVKRHLNI